MKLKTAKDFVKNEKRRKTATTSDNEPALLYAQTVRSLGVDPLRKGDVSDEQARQMARLPR